MASDSNSKNKADSLNLFQPPAENRKPSAEGDDTASYLARRRQQHQDYLKAAKGAQQEIETLRQREERLNKG